MNLKRPFSRVRLLILLLAGPSVLFAQSAISLIQPTQKMGGWQFDNGQEFPGAKGALALAEAQHRDQPVLALQADFTGGGNYVQASVKLPKQSVDTLSFWVKIPPGTGVLPVRLVDGSGQCHQVKLKLNDKGGWQQISVPVERFFKNFGTAGALDLAASYEKWGGANDGRWHQPGRLFVVMATREMGDTSDLLLSDVVLQPPQPSLQVMDTVQLEQLEQGVLDWGFNLGEEFKGAVGGLELVSGQPIMRLHADFTKGGTYVGMRKSFAEMGLPPTKVVRLKMRSETAKEFSVRLVDATGQCHQRGGIALKSDGAWQDVSLVPEKIAGGEHWGGANDGKFHQPLAFMELMLSTRSHAGKKPEVWLSDLRADVMVEATISAASYQENFGSPEAFRTGWKTRGDVTANAGALVLKRSLENLPVETAAVGEAFVVTPGLWQIDYAWKADLHSPDNSYHGAVSLVVADRAGTVLETIPVGIGFGRSDGQEVSRSITLPQGAAKARFRVTIEKTYGSFAIDALSAARLKVQPREQIVERIKIKGDALGHLFFPEEDVHFQITVETKKALAASDQRLRISVRDYQGGDVLPLEERTLTKKDGAYVADITLPTAGLAVGKYYELHVDVPQGTADPVQEVSGFARLPLAPSKSFAAEKIPFTIRNWDSRITEYFHLADRLGIRQLGVWGGWSAKAPYKAHGPGIDLCKELGAKWITGTPAADIERNGFKTYSEVALRGGMKNFLEAYADPSLAMIAIGNEPHGTGKKVLENVRAYQAIYETVKAFDPKIHVLGTSVEPNEAYFKAGYQNYLDSYDFHIYEHYTHVRSTMKAYRALMEKYDAVKPIHSTELGLNSQGQTRLAVSREMIKKVVSFFAEGGATVSWFTIQYPDPDGKARGQSGDAHCMFDCRYNLYNPRLDAITHYHLLNAIGVKRFVEEQHQPRGAQTYLFRDDQGQCLRVVWSDEKEETMRIPFGEGLRVRAIGIDGSEDVLISRNGGISVTVSDDPLLLLYEQP
ncbi:MAG: hypothetical protein ACI97B_001965 [Verrucomicrobiales bacterium]|jgi:hypothetical protein